MARPISELPTDWEFTLLSVLWKEGESSVDDVRETLRTQGIKRSDSSIRTILRNMETKGYVVSKTRGRTTFFKAAVLKKRMEKTVFRHIAHTLFEGKQDEFVLRVLEEARITPRLSSRIRTQLGK